MVQQRAVVEHQRPELCCMTTDVEILCHAHTCNSDLWTDDTWTQLELGTAASTTSPLVQRLELHTRFSHHTEQALFKVGHWQGVYKNILSVQQEYFRSGTSALQASQNQLKIRTKDCLCVSKCSCELHKFHRRTWFQSQLTEADLKYMCWCTRVYLRKIAWKKQNVVTYEDNVGFKLCIKIENDHKEMFEKKRICLKTTAVCFILVFLTGKQLTLVFFCPQVFKVLETCDKPTDLGWWIPSIYSVCEMCRNVSEQIQVRQDLNWDFQHYVP